MSWKELTKIFVITSNSKHPFVSMVSIQIFNVLMAYYPDYSTTLIALC